MSTLLFLLAIIAFLVIVAWTFVNELDGASGGARGLLAMKVAGGAPPAKTGPRWSRRAIAETAPAPDEGAAGSSDGGSPVRGPLAAANPPGQPLPRWRRSAAVGVGDRRR